MGIAFSIQNGDGVFERWSFSAARSYARSVARSKSTNRHFVTCLAEASASSVEETATEAASLTGYP